MQSHSVAALPPKQPAVTEHMPVSCSHAATKTCAQRLGIIWEENRGGGGGNWKKRGKAPTCWGGGWYCNSQPQSSAGPLSAWARQCAAPPPGLTASSCGSSAWTGCSRGWHRQTQRCQTASCSLHPVEEHTATTTHLSTGCSLVAVP